MALVCAAIGSVAVACSENPAAPNPGIAGPVAITSVFSSWSDANGTLVIVANANTEDLRAFVPSSGLFVRGPNAISPLSIPVGFRPQRLAPGAIDADGTALGFVVVGGPANQLVVLDAQTLRVNLSAAEVSACNGGTASSACLPSDVRDVAVAGERAFAVLGPTDGSMGALVATDVVVEEGSPVVTIERVEVIGGDPSSLAVLPDGSRAFVGDGASALVRAVDLTDPSWPVSDIRAAGPVRSVFVTPEYVDANGVTRPAGEFLLALLADGTVQTLDPSTGAPAESPLDPAEDIAPLSLGTPVLDLTFVPCEGGAAGSLCDTELRVSTSETRQEPLIAFAALGDGSAVALFPDPNTPQVYRPLNRTTTGPSAGAVSYADPSASNGAPADAPSLTIEADSLTEGVTRTESITVVHRGVLPGLSQRVAVLEAGGGGLVLTDAQGDLTEGDRMRAGDSVRINALSEPCEALGSTLNAEVATFTDTTLELSTLSRDVPSECLPARVLFEVRAGDDAPWVVEGDATGFLGRAAADERFEATPPRFAYPVGATSGPAFAFVIEGTQPDADDARFRFTTTSGFGPLRISAESTDFTLANGITAIPGRIFVSLIGGDALLDARLAQLTQAGAVRVYREITVSGSSSFGSFGPGGF